MATRKATAPEEPKDPGSLDPDDVREYLRTQEKNHGKKKTVTEEMGKLRGDLVDECGLNKTALSFCERLNRYSPEVRADVLRSVDKIREAMSPVWDQAPELDLGEGKAAA